MHNNPENLKPPSKFKHKQLILADVETEDISKYFNDTYTFIEEAKSAGEGKTPDLCTCAGGWIPFFPSTRPDNSRIQKA